MVITSATAAGRCPLCRSPSCRCGPSTDDIQPIDLPEREDTTVASKLKEYEVEVNGTKTTMQLNERDAERLNATEVKKTTASSNKKRTTSSKE